MALDVMKILVEGALAEPQAGDDVLLHAVCRQVFGLAADLRLQGSVVAPALARAVLFLPLTVSVFVYVDEFLLRLQWQVSAMLDNLRILINIRLSTSAALFSLGTRRPT